MTEDLLYSEYNSNPETETNFSIHVWGVPDQTKRSYHLILERGYRDQHTHMQMHLSGDDFNVLKSLINRF